MGLAAGIIGLPNVGKSTIFNALVSGKAAAENYPFCTIDPNTGIVAVPDSRLDRIAMHIRTDRIVPAFLELIDIAGLVKGASQGEGLGNQFLGHIKEVNALVHVVRCFEDPDVVHVYSSVDPVRDIGIVETELILKDLETVEKSLARSIKAKTSDNSLAPRVALLEELVRDLSSGNAARLTLNTSEKQTTCGDLHLITSKPILYVANMGEGDYVDDSSIRALTEYARSQRSACVVIKGKIESEIAELPETDRCEYLTSLGIQESGLSALTRAIYKLLGLQTFFTFNEKELHAWTIPLRCPAAQAAGVIHSDFEKGFIRADVYSVEEFEQYKSEHALRAAGKIRSEGRDYCIRDGEIVLFRVNP